MKRLRVTGLAAFFLALGVGWVAGWSTDFIDRINYVRMYQGVLASPDFASQLFHAKDLVFLGIVLLVSQMSPDERWAFVTITVSSMLCKIWAMRKIQAKSVLPFVALYSVLLAPGLEFAAIRAALASGLLLLAFAYRSQLTASLALILAAISTHLSVLPAALMVNVRVNLLLRRHAWFIAGIVVLSAFWGPIAAMQLPRASAYLGNTGTQNAIALPVLTLLASFMLLRTPKRTGVLVGALKERHASVSAIGVVVWATAAIALGVTASMVTVAVRLLEIAWVFMLAGLVVTWKRDLLSIGGAILFLGLMAFVNIKRGTWAVLFHHVYGG